MLLPLSRLTPQPVMSLQTGAELARTSDPIIDPRILEIVAVYVTGSQLDTTPSVLFTSDIRELSQLGCIVDDSSVLMGLDGLVRLEEIVSFQFSIFGLPVYDEHNHKLGKVEEITFEPISYTVQQILTKQSLFASLSQASHVIHRSQIVAVTNEKIIVRATTIGEGISDTIHQGAAMMNPFKRASQEHHHDTPSSSP